MTTYEKRADTLKKLITLKAPETVVYFAARNLLRTEHGTTAKTIAAWIRDEIRSKFDGWKYDFQIWKLRRQGWERECAIDIAFGDPESLHKKVGCDCNDDMKKLAAMLRQGSRA